jgi:SAM-dependent methyltransferase
LNPTSMANPSHSPAAAPAAARDPVPASRAVAEFYDRLVFPSRGAHPAYAELLPDQAGERIGEFGCGQSLFYDALREYSPSPVFLDTSMNALRTIDYGFRLRADLARLPFRAAVFDRILCIGVLHHLPERAPSFCEIARVLRPGGRLVLGVYAPGSLQSVLRRLYEASHARAWRRLLFHGTSLLIATRYRMSGRPLPAGDVERRARDILEVPFVRYAPAREYVEEVVASGIPAGQASRIAGMNILQFERSS